VLSTGRRDRPGPRGQKERSRLVPPGSIVDTFYWKIAPTRPLPLIGIGGALKPEWRLKHLPVFQTIDRGAWVVQLKARVDRFTLQRQNSEHALVHPPQGFSPHEALQCFNPEREFPDRQRPLAGQTSVS
jgi:hypothetical protein